ncbi:MAG: T9SS type A sorting domain-containing protein [Saprospiraceae bacterium]|nr:T9SS type A sorting domain-containing protein [Saprospiraceae bacterium]
MNGVSTYDMVLIRKHILGMEYLDSPYKIIAADVNHSNGITTYDLVEIQKAILHITDAFANNTSWRFVDAAYVFPNPTNPFVEVFPEVYNINDLNGNMNAVDFKAIKIGDVNGSAAPNDFDEPNEERSGDHLELSIKDEALSGGQTYTLDVTSENFQAIIGYQFTLRFNTEQLDFQSVEMGELPNLSEANFGFRRLEEGVLTTSWNNDEPTSMDKDAVLFSLVFVARQQTQLSQALHLGSDYTKAEAYYETGELLDLSLDFSAPSTVNRQPSTVSITPNPFKASSVIGFTLPAAQEAALFVHDAAGRLVMVRKGSFAKGYNEVRVSKSELPSAGTYFFRLQTAGEVTTGKLVLVE